LFDDNDDENENDKDKKHKKNKSKFKSFSTSSSFSSSTENGVTKESGVKKEEMKSKDGSGPLIDRKYGEKYKKYQDRKRREASLLKRAKSNVEQEQMFLNNKGDKSKLNVNQEKV